MTKKSVKTSRLGSTLDSFLEEEGVLTELESLAKSEVNAWQDQKATHKSRNIAGQTGAPGT